MPRSSPALSIAPECPRTLNTSKKSSIMPIDADTIAKKTVSFIYLMGLHHHHHADHEHGHTHEHLSSAGHFQEREMPLDRDFTRRAFTVRAGGPVGSGKNPLMR